MAANHHRFSKCDVQLGCGKALCADHYAIHEGIHYTIHDAGNLAGGATVQYALSGCDTAGVVQLAATAEIHLQWRLWVIGGPFYFQIIKLPQWRRAAAPTTYGSNNSNDQIGTTSDLTFHVNAEFNGAFPYGGTVVWADLYGGAAAQAVIRDSGGPGVYEEHVLKTADLRIVPPQNPAAHAANGYGIRFINTTAGALDYAWRLIWHEIDNG